MGRRTEKRNGKSWLSFSSLAIYSAMGKVEGKKKRGKTLSLKENVSYYHSVIIIRKIIMIISFKKSWNIYKYEKSQTTEIVSAENNFH